MIDNPLNAADQVLIARLGTIVPANGYLTDLGTRIHTEWIGALLDAEEITYPCITIQPDEYPAPSSGGDDYLVYMGRRIIGLADPGHPNGCLAQLNDIYVDLLRCLHVPEGMPNPWGPKGPRKVTFKPTQPFLPDKEVPKGTVVIPVQLHVVVNGA